MHRLSYLLFALLLLPFVAMGQGRRTVTPLLLERAGAVAYHYADSVMATMTLREQLAQLIMPMVWPTADASKLAEWDRMVTEHRFGGVLFQKGDPRHQLAMTSRMRTTARVPMLVAVDGEWGLSMRLSHTLRYPKNMLIGAVGSIDLAREYGNAVAYEMHRMGVHINFAPTVDVNNNPANPVIGVRSYGSSPLQVSLLGMAFSLGLEEKGVLSCAKHFPGHGNTDVDSHKALPVISGSRKSLEQNELLPFRRYIERGFGAVMIGHLRVPALGADPRPASLSKAVVTDLLRHDMGFGGLIVTDALAMEGVLTDKRLSVAVEAFKAGAHVLLASAHPVQDLDQLEAAVARREITPEAVAQRCRELLAMKRAVNAHEKGPLSSANLYADLVPEPHRALIETLNARAMTLVKNEEEMLPLRTAPASARQRIALLCYGPGDCSALTSSLKKYHTVSTFTYLSKLSRPEKEHLFQQLRGYSTIVIALTTDRQSLAPELLPIASRSSVVLLSMTTPYALLRFSPLVERSKAVAIAYENTEGAQRAMGEALCGAQPFEGKLPVDLRPLFRAGTGHSTQATRLAEALPERVGLSSHKLRELDRIALQGIADGAYPGCQILVAKGGMVVYHKAFGFKAPQQRDSVTLETLYDLASVTKAAATVPLTMVAVDEGKVALDDSLALHLPYLQGSNKGQVQLSSLLHHVGGMPASIPFYTSLIDTASYTPPLYTYSRKPPYTTQIAARSYARTDWRYLPSLVAPDSSSLYPYRFAPHLYLHVSVADTMRAAIASAPVSHPQQRWRYSDIDFLLLQDVLEARQGMGLDAQFARYIAEPLGLERLLFKPYTRYAATDVAEGQNDQFLRRTTLRGDVDDESAAMRGGVGGSAGLFGTAGDLAVLLQMLLNEGYYGDTRVLSSETVRHFVYAKHPDSPYALGFDKYRGPNGPTAPTAHPSTYGHYGFTGTCFWVDPHHQLIFIFLSNRVAPIRWNPKLSSERIRPQLHEAIYQAMS